MAGVDFIDTNIFLYAASAAQADAVKRRRARKLIRNTPFVISSQVLQEFVANALGKKSLGLGEAQIAAFLAAFDEGDVIPVTLDLVASACTLRIRYGISQWDASILAAAAGAGCGTLYTEDLNHGQLYGGVRVVNPFL